MAAEVANLKLAEYMDWVASQKERWDRYAIEQTRQWEKQEAEEAKVQAEAQGIKKGMEKGIEKGLEEGMEKGRQEAIIQIAKTMKANNVSFDIIIESTGLSEDEINKL